MKARITRLFPRMVTRQSSTMRRARSTNTPSENLEHGDWVGQVSLHVAAACRISAVLLCMVGIQVRSAWEGSCIWQSYPKSWDKSTNRLCWVLKHKKKRFTISKRQNTRPQDLDSLTFLIWMHLLALEKTPHKQCLSWQRSLSTILVWK